MNGSRCCDTRPSVSTGNQEETSTGASASGQLAAPTDLRCSQCVDEYAASWLDQYFRSWSDGKYQAMGGGKTNDRTGIGGSWNSRDKAGSPPHVSHPSCTLSHCGNVSTLLLLAPHSALCLQFPFALTSLPATEPRPFTRTFPGFMRDSFSQ